MDELFCSNATPQTLDLLGDLALEQGDFATARAWWRCLAPLPSADSAAGEFGPVRYPSTTRIDLVRVQAKQILALAFEGLLTRAQAELDAFHQRFPEAHGMLAAQDGRYSEILQAAIEDVIKAGIANNTDPWPTYAGSAGRNQVLTVCPSALLWEDGPTWRVGLPAIDAPPKGKDKNAPPMGTPRRTAFHPVVAAGQILIADAESVTSYQLTTGKRLFRYDLQGAGLAANSIDRKAPLPCFTLTAEAGRVYARLGRQRLAPRKDGDSVEPCYLVCLDLAEPANPNRPREKWHVKAQADEFFEGAPLVRAGRAYVALSRLAGKRVVTAIQCYDALGPAALVAFRSSRQRGAGIRGQSHAANTASTS